MLSQAFLTRDILTREHLNLLRLYLLIADHTVLHLLFLISLCQYWCEIVLDDLMVPLANGI